MADSTEPASISTFGGHPFTRTRLVSWDERNTAVGVGQEPQAGDESRVVLDVLEELGEEEHHSVHAGVTEASRPVGRSPGLVGQDPQGQDRLRRVGLDLDEGGDESGAPHQRDDGDRSAQPDEPASTSPSTTPVMPRVEVIAPARSKRPLPALGLLQHRHPDGDDGEPDRAR